MTEIVSADIWASAVLMKRVFISAAIVQQTVIF